MYKTVIKSEKKPTEVLKLLQELSKDPEIEEIQANEQQILINTKANSYKGFGLSINGIIQESNTGTDINATVSIRHDFRLFNIIFVAALLIALFYNQAKINSEILKFEEKIPYILMGFSFLMIFNLTFTFLPWIRLRNMIYKVLGIKK